MPIVTNQIIKIHTNESDQKTKNIQKRGGKKEEAEERKKSTCYNINHVSMRAVLTYPSTLVEFLCQMPYSGKGSPPSLPLP